ncbi:hypothetical protein [Ovoidimarina sediminis]|uniref:hypothetical protein n=1 Tax=Ovoidimarina sediminis TaxID=3079856 RepID=UPI002909F9B8|nr:hypothetical protein [Rhodophyticola sp. MJ-SS7]MDU8944927.1 hypothetical protein [Rhodophyticola sp. MJ-SS7]
MIGRVATVFAFAVNLMLAAIVAGAALPGQHRILMPKAYGLSEIAPRVWTDAPGRRAELLALRDRAKARVAAFFEDAPPDPALVLCTTEACREAFRIRGNGLSIADLVVMAAPGGLTEGTLTHEMTHSRLHRSMGLSNLVRPPYPTWFDEGLATRLADHPKWTGTIRAADRARVREVRRSWQLRPAFGELGVGRTYRAAAAEVARIERLAGRAGLLALIRRAEAGEDFDRVLKEVTGE